MKAYSNTTHVIELTDDEVDLLVGEMWEFMGFKLKHEEEIKEHGSENVAALFQLLEGLL